MITSRYSFSHPIAFLSIVLVTILWVPASSAQDQVQVHQQGSGTRAAMVEAAGAALWRHQGQRVRFRPVRVATEGNWGFLGALPVDPTSEDLCYDAEADFGGGEAEFHVLLYNFSSEWHVVKLGAVCHDEASLSSWAAFLGEDLIGTRFLLTQ